VIADEKRFQQAPPHDTSSPPSSIPRPVPLPSDPRPTLLVLGLPLGGTKVSKLRRFRASFAASGVLGRPGVRLPNAPCAGLGVTLTKSAKLNCWPGVLKPAMNPPPVPGVVIMDEGSARWLEGGVEGGKIRAWLLLGLAGEGEVAR
ncbi:MAG: hypothetical protein LQ347_007083, partial [Umbilicaria vellea]